MNEACGLVNITDRRKIELTGIKAVDSFDEFAITLSVISGKLCIEGEGLSITVLDLDKGLVCAEGKISAVIYTDGNVNVQRGFFKGLFGGKGQ